MPRYVEKALKKYDNRESARVQYAPHTWNQPNYGKNTACRSTGYITSI